MMNHKPTLFFFLLLHKNCKSQVLKICDKLKEYEQENVESRIMIFLGYNRITK